MKTSKIVLVSVFITAAILALIGGVTRIALAKQNTIPTASPAEIQALKDNEARYQQLIEQANRQLEKANTEIQALQGQIQSAQVQQASASQPALSVAVQPDQAAQIAQKAADLGQTMQKNPELVSFQGKAAYEVVFEKGSIYVDAQSGEVLFNGTKPQEITQEQAAKIASDYLSIKDILQVDQITFRGAPLWRVIFKNGTMAYLDVTGQITYVQKAAPIVMVQPDYSSGAGQTGSQTPAGDHEHETTGGED